MDNDFRTQLVELTPDLRAFARFLTRERDRADDLVQETLVKALTAADQFTAGTNLKSWLFTILRNQFYSELRKAGSPTAVLDEEVANHSAQAPTQESHLEFGDFQEAVWRLSEGHREGRRLVGGRGRSYEEGARICGCAIGTSRSRLSRARYELSKRFYGHAPNAARARTTRAARSRPRKVQS